VRLPFALLCAVAALAVAGCGGDDGGGGGGASGGGGESDCSGAARTATEVTGDLRPGWRASEAPSETLNQFRQMLAGADKDEGKLEKLTGRSVRKDVEGAVVIVMEVDKPVDLDDMVEGAQEGSGGKQGTTVPIGDDPDGGRMFSTDDGGASLFGVTEQCSAVIVLGTSPVVAQRVAKMLSL
jgi:hypothetical protein